MQGADRLSRTADETLATSSRKQLPLGAPTRMDVSPDLTIGCGGRGAEAPDIRANRWFWMHGDLVLRAADGPRSSR